MDMRGQIISSGFRHGFRLCGWLDFHAMYPCEALRKSFTMRGPNEWVTLLTSHGGSVPCGSQWATQPTRQPPLAAGRITKPVMYDIALYGRKITLKTFCSKVSIVLRYLTNPFFGGKSLCGTERDSNICSPLGPVSNHERIRTKSRGFNGGGHDTNRERNNENQNIAFFFYYFTIASGTVLNLS